MSKGIRATLARVAIAALVTAAALLLRLPLEPVLQSEHPYLTFFPAVLVAGYFGGRLAGFTATVLGALAAGFFLLEPHWSFTIGSWREVFALVLFLLAGGLMSMLSGLLHRARSEAQTLCAERDALLRHAPVGFAFFGLDRRAIRVNPALAELRGQAPEKLAGQPIDAVLPPGERPADSLLEQVFTTARPVLGQQWTGRDFSGEERTWLLTVYPVRQADGQPSVQVVGLIVIDVSEQQRLEQELRRWVHELAESDRRKDIFLAMLSHELRNPLAALRTSADLLERGVPARPRIVGMIGRQLSHLTRLVDDLLDTARISRSQIELRRQVIEVDGVVETAIEMVQPAIDQRGHTLTVNAPEGPLRIEADPTRVAQVLAHLLDNAAHFTPHGGRIRLDVLAEADELVCRVSDTGIGIRPEMRGRIFELFQQADRPADQAPAGLGLGLTLVRRLVELHGGSVAASSPGPGQGSTFEVRLPGLVAAPERVAAAREGRSVALAPTRRVLVVDDNDDAGQSLALLLGSRGHEVHVVGDGQAALDEVERWKPDVVILDIGLPGMDGFEVAQRLRSQESMAGLRLVALTGYGQEEDRRRGREVGFDEFLVKPTGPEEVVRAVQPPGPPPGD
jgi:PAS domain S-box-containing protein